VSREEEISILKDISVVIKKKKKKKKGKKKGIQIYQKNSH
jgi:hypothetical protein